MKKNKYYQKYSSWLRIVVLLLIIPILVSDAYLMGTPDGKPNTAYTAGDFLSFYGTLLSCIGTFFLGFVAYNQNKKANEINNRLLTLEEESKMPLIDFMTFDLNNFQDHLQYEAMIFDFSKNRCNSRTLVFFVKNLSTVHINNIKINSIKIFQDRQEERKTRYINDLIKMKFTDLVFECINSELIDSNMTNISSKEYKFLHFYFDDIIKNYAPNPMIKSSFTTRFEIEIIITTYSNREYKETITFISQYDKEHMNLSNEKNLIVNKNISIMKIHNERSRNINDYKRK